LRSEATQTSQHQLHWILVISFPASKEIQNNSAMTEKVFKQEDYIGWL
jgi:hypothetical protein